MALLGGADVEVAVALSVAMDLTTVLDNGLLGFIEEAMRIFGGE